MPVTTSFLSVLHAKVILLGAKQQSLGPGLVGQH